MSESILNRASIRMKTPNPLFEKWISEWIVETESSGNLTRSNSLKNALVSLKKIPIVLNSGKECMILEHFDTNLCVQLDRKLVSHRKSNDEKTIPERPKDITGSSGLPAVQNEGKISRADKSKQGKKGRLKEYRPTYRSAPYALLVTLYKNENTADYKGYMTKEELQIKAQSLCNTSLKKAQAGSFYSGWASMTQLISKGLVQKTNNPSRYSLTVEGRLLGQTLSCVDSLSEDLKLSQDLPSVVEIANAEDIIAPVSLRSNKRKKMLTMDVEENMETDVEDVYLTPGTFDIILLVDCAETSGPSCNDITISGLKSTGVKFEIRHLKVGDFMWICRGHNSSNELVLPFIVERKRIDDLAKSIIDGRFHEQKFRLKKSGVYNNIYLIEGVKGSKFSLPITSIQQAVVNTMVSDEFTVKITKNHSESMVYLATVTTLLTNMYRNKVLFSSKQIEYSGNLADDSAFLRPFKAFISGLGKTRNFKTKELFVKQLVQLHGISVDKAWAITSLYATPAAYISALKSSAKPDELVSNVYYGVLNRKVGPVISKQLYQFYTRPILLD